MADRISIHAASGGLGASTLSVALAVVAARAGCRVAVVDAVMARGGLDVTACIEHLPGLRWPDLTLARGSIDGTALVAALPQVEGAALLAASARGEPPAAEVRQATLRGLQGASDLVVVDRGTDWRIERRTERGTDRGDLTWDEAASGMGAEILLAATSARGIADASAAVAGWADSDPPHLLVRGDAALGESLADHLGVPLLACWPTDARLLTDERRGIPPGSRRGALTTLAAQLLAQLGSEGDALAASA